MFGVEDYRIRLTVLGARGSVAVSGKDKTEFGCATSSYIVEANGQTIILDAGTGILNAPADLSPGLPVTLLLSHTHMDHVLGLPFFSALTRRGCTVNIYGKTRDGLTVEEQLRKFLSPPLWPVWLSVYPAQITFREPELPMEIGGVLVEGIESFHPNGSTVYRLSFGGRSLVYATDFEHSDEASLRALTEFSRDTDLLMYDGQYSVEEYERSRGFGHSTPEMGLRVFRESGAKRLMLVHHDPRHTDDRMRALEEQYGSDTVMFAREGDVITL